MIKRLTATLIILCLCFSMLVGCGKDNESGKIKNNDEGQSTDNEKVTIRLMTRWGAEPTDKALLELVDKFQEENPNIKIVNESITGSTDDKAYFDKLKTAIATGDLYEVTMNYGGGNILEYVKNDVYLDFQPYLDEDETWANGFYDLFDLWQFKGVEGTYGVPLKLFAVNIYYNKEVFEKYGLEPPTTIKEFEEVSNKLLENGIVPMAMAGKNNWRHAHLITSLSMKRFGFDKTKALGERTAKYTDSDMLEVFGKIDEWHKMGVFGENILSLDYDKEKAMFFSGETAMHMDGTWFLGELENREGLDINDIGYMNFPYYEDYEEFRTCAMGGADGGLTVANIKDEAKREAAIALVKYLTSKEATEYVYSKTTSQVLARRVEVPYPEEQFYNELKSVLLNDNKTLRMELNSYDPLPQMIDRLRNSIQGMLAGNTPEEAAAEIQEEIDRNN